MFPHRPRYPRRADAPSPGACEQLTRLAYELLDAHDDTARIATGQDLDLRWQAHLSYLRDLQRVGRELLAHAGRQFPEDCEPGTTGNVNRLSRRAPISRRVRP
jgi:hypothetical protein